MDYIMYILINTDLNMSKGRTAAQVGHIVQVLTEESVKNIYESKPTTYCINYLKWKQRATIVILKASEQELRDLISEPDARYFVDDIDDVSKLTTVGFFPSNTKKDFFARFNLF